MKILLDTHILVKASGNNLSEARMALINDKSNELFISDISFWEVTKLVEHGRLEIDLDLEDYLRMFSSNTHLRRIHLDPDVMKKILKIAPQTHKDPADQIIVASALVYGTHLMTDDRKIRESKLVPVL